MPGVWRGVWVAALLCCVARARGQELLATGAPAAPANGPEACAWVLLRVPAPKADPDRTDDAQVLLVPPFGVDGQPRTPGVFRLVRSLANWPDAVAADGNQLTVAIPGQRGPIAGMSAPPGPTEVLSLWVQHDAGRWVSASALDSSPVLPAERPVLAMTAVPGGFLAVIGADATGGAQAAGTEVVLLSLGAWGRVEVPKEASAVLASATTVRLVTTHTGAALVLGGPVLDEVHIWHAAVTPGKREYDDLDDPDSAVAPPPRVTPARVVWSEVAAPTPPRGSAALQVTSVDGQVVLAWVGESATTLMAGQVPGTGAEKEKAAQWRRLATVEGAAGELVVAPLANESRVVVVWKGEGVQPAPAGTENTLGLKFAEVSGATGRVLAQGDVDLAGPATRSDFRAVAMLLAWVSGIVAVIVVKPREERTLLVPGGMALAEPAQRLIAGTIDLVLCLVAAGFIVGRGPLDVLTTSATGLLTSTQGQLLLVLTVLIGTTTGTLTEWATGRTIGKVLCGCAAADLTRQGVVEGAPFQRMRFGQALVRNIVKWCVPPAGLVGVLGGSARHRGDEYAGAGVLSAVREDEDAGE